MRLLASPIHDPEAVFDACVAQLASVADRDRLSGQKQAVVTAYVSYKHASESKQWCNLPRAEWGNPLQPAVGNITKGEMNSLYSNCLVGSKGSPRDVYDEILISANGRCPFCGGLGHVATLDHYLPKAYYPAYAVFPGNLVPCCRDCNTGIGTTYAQSEGDQVLNPYFDDPKFFNERWVSVDFYQQDIYANRYYVDAPADWSLMERQRIEKHFNSYKLGRRFAIEAAAEIVNILNFKDVLRDGYSSDFMRQYVYSQAISPAYDVNGWKRSFYWSLFHQNWFF